MTRRIRLIIAGGAVLAVAVAGISWFAFASGNDMGEGATSAKSLDEAKVPVSVVLSADARRLSVNIDWHDELDALRGDDRFTARVMAGSEEIVLKQWEDTRPDVDSFTLEFTEVEATLLLAAVESGDAVVAVTQQSDTDLDTDSLYEANFATVLTIQARTASVRPAGVAATATFELASMQAPTPGAAPVDRSGSLQECSEVSIAPKANLSGCSLTGADLFFADLTGANLSNTHLAGATLTGANLTSANLTSAYLFGATMTVANLTGADLFRASLIIAKLGRADLTSASLQGATLHGAYLRGANMTGANLIGANLIGADLGNADLTGADLTGATCSSGQKATGTPPAC
jgi:uncharacterized protein YjbI with pentapeptide repeats